VTLTLVRAGSAQRRSLLVPCSRLLSRRPPSMGSSPPQNRSPLPMSLVTCDATLQAGTKIAPK